MQLGQPTCEVCDCELAQRADTWAAGSYWQLFCGRHVLINTEPVRRNNLPWLLWGFCKYACSSCNINTCQEDRNNKNDSWASWATKQKHQNNSLRQASVGDQTAPAEPRLLKSSQRRLIWNKANSQHAHNIIFHLLAEHRQTLFGSNGVLVLYVDEFLLNWSIWSMEWWKVFNQK